MFEHPWWLAALALVPIVRWLHRYAASAGTAPVAAAFLWRSDTLTGVRDASAHPPDPAWRRRALIVALLVLALAGLRWPGNRGAPVIVWVDDSQSLYTRDGDGTRMAHALHDLGIALEAAHPAQVELRSLANPAAALDLTKVPAAVREQAAADWARAPRGEPRVPLPAALDAQHEHWLVTDGADAEVVSWAQSARLARIVQAGTACANAAVTLLALRAPITAGAPLAGLIEVTNACAAPAQRRLQLRVGAKLVLDEFLPLGPEQTVQRSFAAQDLPVRAELARGDPLTLDDALTVDGRTLTPVATRVAGACPDSIVAALRAHPRLRITSASPALEIVCGEDRASPPGVRRIHLPTGASGSRLQGPLAWMDAGPLESLALDSDWLSRTETALRGPPLLTDGALSLVTRTPSGLDVGLLLGLPPFDSRPEQAALLAGLIDVAMGRELLGEIASTRLPATATRIAPLPLPAPRAAHSTRASMSSLASFLIGAALLMLLYDLARTPGVTARLARGIAVLLCLLAGWNPANPFHRPPLDLALLLDESGSMPEQAGETAWQALRARALPAGSRVSVTRFGATPVDEGTFDAAALPAHVPARLAVDGTRTNIADALVQSLRGRDAARGGIVVLASDAVENAGDATAVLEQAHAAGIPVLLLAPERSAAARATIENVEVPPNAATGQRIPLAVRVTTPAAATLEIEDGGERVQVPVASGTRALQLWLAPSADRTRTIGLRLLAAEGEVLDERVQPLTLAGAPSVLVVTRAPRSAIAGSLQAGGRQVTIAAPGSLEQALEQTGVADVVILDDIAADEASDAGWNALAHAVRDGAGLAVLGGPHSFMAGRYQDATIDALLPVISAPPHPQAPAAVLFVIDKSGSMGRATTAGATRFELARQAVLSTARTLPPSDLVGLLAFDVSPQLALPLTAGGAAAIETAWSFNASGGTALAPALDAAITALAAVPPEQRLLVLATDGFAPAESFDALIGRIERAHIDVIALAIGDEPDLAVLARLTAVNDGALERVTDVATLPRLMNADLAARRAGVEQGRIEPVQRAALPFFAGGAWPPLDAYAVTTARPGARVCLTSAQGDPLIALDESGAGRVVVLTAGLGTWAHAWQSWTELPALLGGLVDWLGSRTSARVHGGLVETAGKLQLEIDAVEDGGWSTAPSARVAWVDPQESVSVIAADAAAPGRYAVELPVTGAGDYRAAIDVGGARTSARYTRAAGIELRSSEAAQEARERWIANGLLQRWPEGLDGVRSAGGSLRTALLGVALATFIAALLGGQWRRGRTNRPRNDDTSAAPART